MSRANPSLWAAIEASGLKHYRLAERVGISPRRLSRIVRGRARADADLRLRLAEALHRSPDDLFPAT